MEWEYWACLEHLADQVWGWYSLKLTWADSTSWCSDHLLSIVWNVYHLSVKFSHSYLLKIKEPLGQFSPKSIWGWRRFKVICLNDGPFLFSRRELEEQHSENTLRTFQNYAMTSTNLGTNHFWVKGVQVCLNKSLLWDNQKLVKILLWH